MGSSSDLLFGHLLDFFFLFLSSDPLPTDPMETEATGEEEARGNTDDAAATEEEAGADDPAGEEGQGPRGCHRGRSCCDGRGHVRDHLDGPGTLSSKQPPAQPLA